MPDHDADDTFIPPLDPLDPDTWLEHFAYMIFGVSLTQSKEQGRCVCCKEEVEGFVDIFSRRSYSESGLCQSCQDSIT